MLIGGDDPQSNPTVKNFYVIGSACNSTTSHTRVRARDHYTSSTLIGGKGGAGPSSLLHTTARGTNRVCECKMDVTSTWIPTWHRMGHVSRSLGLFSKTTSWR